MLLKAGDIVEIRKDLKYQVIYGNFYFIRSMNHSKGKKFLIDRIEKRTPSGVSFRIYATNDVNRDASVCTCIYTLEMVERAYRGNELIYSRKNNKLGGVNANKETIR